MSEPTKRARGRSRWLLLATGAALCTAFAALLLRAQALPEGPAPIVWDKEACAHCRMHVGEPSMAAQAQLTDGRVLNFDDPGCLLSWLEQHREPLRAVYVHHHREDRWLPREQAGFVPVSSSPMGFDLGAVDRGAEGALTWEEAAAKVRAQPRMLMGSEP